MTDKKIDDILSLVQQNFYFLHVGKFLDEYIKRHDMSKEARDINIICTPHSGYKLSGARIKDSLSEIFNNGNQSSFFGHHIAWNAFRGIMMAIYEGKEETPFRDYLETKLTPDKYKHFEFIISFIRNVLSHNIEDEIRLNKTDFERTRKSFSKVCKTEIAQINFAYSRYLPEVKIPANYGFTIEVDFSKIKPGERFLDIISEFQLYMLSELCFNLCKLYRPVIQ